MLGQRRSHVRTVKFVVVILIALFVFSLAVVACESGGLGSSGRRSSKDDDDGDDDDDSEFDPDDFDEFMEEFKPCLGNDCQFGVMADVGVPAVIVIGLESADQPIYTDAMQVQVDLGTVSEPGTYSLYVDPFGEEPQYSYGLFAKGLQFTSFEDMTAEGAFITINGEMEVENLPSIGQLMRMCLYRMSMIEAEVDWRNRVVTPVADNPRTLGIRKACFEAIIEETPE